MKIDNDTPENVGLLRASLSEAVILITRSSFTGQRVFGDVFREVVVVLDRYLSQINTASLVTGTPTGQVHRERGIYEELRCKDRSIAELKNNLEERNNIINDLKADISEQKALRIKSEESLAPVTESLNAMTAERSKWIRKLKRAGINS